MKPDQAAQDGLQEHPTTVLEHDANRDAATKPTFAEPEERENRSVVAAVSEMPPEPSNTLATSPRKIEANRRNALRSTGPRTPSGKSRVSQNARKHGIFSQHLLTNDVDGAEQPREFWRLHAAITQHYAPQGPLEELLVDKIVTWSWRLARVVRCERGQIDRALAAHRFQAEHGRVNYSDSPEMTTLHNAEEDQIVDDLFVPSNGELDKLLRYEDMISKQLDRTIAELERLQTRRQRGAQVSDDSAKQSQ
jgi:hypothetical protein